MSESNMLLSHQQKQVSGKVVLTGSKSESNRALIIQALSHGHVQVQNVSEAADTVTMLAALQAAAKATDQETFTIDIGPAGTAMRFLTSYLNLLPGNFVLTGTKRMQERPITLLVDALRSIGANISYDNNEGYPPLRISGQLSQTASEVSIPGNISSQYISSLLLIASSLEKGLSLHIEGELTSRPYVTMTLDMLTETGINYDWNDDSITIRPQEFKPNTIYVEPDWSAASYWYAIVALSKSGDISLPGLKKHSLQGDSKIVEIMEYFGVQTIFRPDGIVLQKTTVPNEKIHFDFKECPDLAQTVVVVAAAMRRNITLTGLETLRIKETDRIKALQNELGKFGCELVEQNDIFQVKTEDFFVPKQVSIATYEDHRMAMAFAPLALIFPKVEIEDPSVVEKSYPGFWLDLQKQGFEII